MKKLSILFALVAVSFGSSLNAQKMDLGLGGALALPMGDFSDASDMGFGGNISLNYFITEQISAGVEVNGLFFPETDYGIASNLYTSFPIQVVGRYFFLTDDFKPYAGLGLGFYLMQNELRYSQEYLEANTSIKDQNIDQGGFGISPRIGFDYAFNKWVALNLEVNYNLVFNEKTESIIIEVPNPSDPANPIQAQGEATYPATPFLGVNLGLKFTLFDNSPEVF